ncbi:MAG: (d)CMP kinase [Lentisphaeria bacterium]|nr:(d)CMP kinase [Lentisphaeria bacterium]MBR7127011.1 (d)CMP kinase [Lentisphaeria bacterium]
MGVSVIAMDGPAASGKSTIASHLAKRLSIPYVNTGSMFRAVAYFLNQRGINAADTEAIKAVLAEISMDYKLDENGEYSLYLNDRKLDAELRTPEVVAIVSLVATVKEVRDLLKNFQREIASSQLVVMEGRDIGSVVFPDANWKFFVTASPMVRAERRLKQDGTPYTQEALQKVADSIAERDRLDSERPIAPLKQCEDAVLVDTSNMTIDETVDFIAAYIK